MQNDYQAVRAQILGGDLSVNTLFDFGQMAEYFAEVAQHTRYPGFDEAAKQIPEALSTIQLLMGELSKAPATEFTERVVPDVIAGLGKLSAGRITGASALVAGAVVLSAAYLTNGQRSDSDGWLSANWDRGHTPGTAVSV